MLDESSIKPLEGGGQKENNNVEIVEKKWDDNGDVAPYESRRDGLNDWEKEKIKEQEEYLEKRLGQLPDLVDHYMSQGNATKNRFDIVDNLIPITTQQCLESVDSMIKNEVKIGSFAYELTHLKEEFLAKIEQIKINVTSAIEEKKQNEIREQIGS
jgi:hypothetical protein